MCPQHRGPLVVMPHPCLKPTEMLRHFRLPSTRVGVVRGVPSVPTPSWAYSFAPQQYAVLSVAMPQVLLPPAAIDRNALADWTSTGTIDEYDAEGFPSWP